MDVIIYGLLAASLIVSVASLLTLNVALIALSLALILALIVMHKLGYVVEAVIFRRTNIIQVLGNQQLSGDRTTATREVEGGFVATATALLMGDSKETVDRERIEGIIARLNFPFKFVLHVEGIDTKKLLDRLQTMRSMREIELARTGGDGKGANSARVPMLKREIEQIEQDIRSISSGVPVRLARYVVTSAKSESRFSAEERARSQVRELAGEFGALLNSGFRVLTGNELLDALEMDSMVA